MVGDIQACQCVQMESAKGQLNKMLLLRNPWGSDYQNPSRDQGLQFVRENPDKHKYYQHILKFHLPQTLGHRADITLQAWDQFFFVVSTFIWLLLNVCIIHSK